MTRHPEDGYVMRALATIVQDLLTLLIHFAVAAVVPART